jgi:hypothetical protein
MKIDTKDISLEQAVVMGSNLLGFGKGLSAQEREDVRNTFQLATLVANRSFDKKTQAEAWFNRLMTVMADTGWLALNARYGAFNESSQRVKLRNVLLSVLETAVKHAVASTQVGAVLSALAGETLARLPRQGDAIELYRKSSHTDTGAIMGVASCAKDPEGEIILALGVVDAATERHGYDVLLLDWSSDKARLHQASMVLTVAPSMFNRSREGVAQALGHRAEENIRTYLDLLKD